MEEVRPAGEWVSESGVSHGLYAYLQSAVASSKSIIKCKAKQLFLAVSQNWLGLTRLQDYKPFTRRKGAKNCDLGDCNDALLVSGKKNDKCSVPRQI